MAKVWTLQSVSGTEYASIDDSGNVNATGELRIDDVAVASIDTSGHITIADTYALKLGTGGTDDQVSASGTNTLWTHVTGNLTIDNTNVTGSTILLLGTDTTATKVAVQTNSANDVFSVTPASATTGTTLVAGTLDLNGLLDQDAALTGTGDAANIAATINHATQTAEALDVSIAQLTAVRSSGIVAAVKAGVTSLAADTGGDFVCIQLASTDGGGTTPTHSGIYCADALDALIKVSADGKGGFVVGSTMTISPESTAESGYIKVAIGATIYQIPIYAA